MASKRKCAEAGGKGPGKSRHVVAEGGDGSDAHTHGSGRRVIHGVHARRRLGIVGESVQDVMRHVEPIANEPAFRFHVELSLEPGRTCWREIVVPQDWTFYDLHEAIQSCFLWWDYHLFDFKLRMQGRQVEISDPECGGVDAMFSFMHASGADRERLDAGSTPLTDAFPRSRTARYMYDHGDGWEHRVKLVETIPLYRGEMPVCTGGVGDAPPEDVGGPYGFEEFVCTMADARDPDHASVEAWAHDQHFEHFSVAAVNRRMRAWRTGELFDEWDERNGGDGF